MLRKTTSVNLYAYPIIRYKYYSDDRSNKHEKKKEIEKWVRQTFYQFLSKPIVTSRKI